MGFDRNSNELQKVYKRVGANISYLRKQRNLTQESLAAELNISSQALISQYENARKALTLEKIMEFCAYFNVPLEKILLSDLMLMLMRNKPRKVALKFHPKLLYKNALVEPIMLTTLKNKTRVRPILLVRFSAFVWKFLLRLRHMRLRLN